eukprot:TRINITY_DN16767_c0_g1_i2.p1 TRINITY_DN16767_c0_g1~~TRINITY_DN16767_c0_g1_i2.p1  ORF type:complete len:178 (-),score=46.70 TRINITY_DN16767_c0_g1_i2:48-581(-)
MGCNSSKKEDIQKDRQRLQSPSVSSPARSKPMGISSGSSGKPEEPVQDIYGKSQTDQRLEEQDFLRNIIERTQQNFINVSQKPAMLEEKDAVERAQNYQEQISNTAPQQNLLPSLFALPSPAQPNLSSSEAAQLISSTHISDADVQTMLAAAEAVRNALSQMAINHQMQIVVPLDSF